MKKSFYIKLLLLCLVFVFFLTQDIQAKEPWYLSFYAGQSNHKKYIDYFKLNSAPEDSYIFAIAGGKSIFRLHENVTIDAEGIIAQHAGKQSNQEFGIALILRTRFNISDSLNLGFAVGDGLSYTSTIPKIETDNSEDTARLLNLLLTEVTVGFNKSRIDTFLRIHHRSGIFGSVSGVDKGGSNFLAIGIRYYFH
ncbi:MAG: hypothetical protein N3A62_05725 [Thermodesulfovibrionales bacterium]|nr:hypothetical protein [Thermodesulfovibrionales bacterium]